LGDRQSVALMKNRGEWPSNWLRTAHCGSRVSSVGEEYSGREIQGLLAREKIRPKQCYSTDKQTRDVLFINKNTLGNRCGKEYSALISSTWKCMGEKGKASTNASVAERGEIRTHGENPRNRRNIQIKVTKPQTGTGGSCPFFPPSTIPALEGG